MTEKQKLLQLVSQLPLEKWKMDVGRAFIDDEVEDDVQELKLESNEDTYAKYVISIIDECIIPKIKKKLVQCNKFVEFIQTCNNIFEIELKYNKFLCDPNYFRDVLKQIPYPNTPYYKLGGKPDYYVDFDVIQKFRSDDFETVISWLKTVLSYSGLSFEEEKFGNAESCGMIKISGYYNSYLYLDYIVNNWKKYLCEPQKVKKH